MDIIKNLIWLCFLAIKLSAQVSPQENEDWSSMVPDNAEYGGYHLSPLKDSLQNTWDSVKNLLEYKFEVKLQKADRWWNDSQEVKKRVARQILEDKYDSIGRSPYITSEDSPWPRDTSAVLPRRFWHSDDRFHGVVEVKDEVPYLPNDQRERVPQRVKAR